jgi:hypothetical protein
MLYISYYQIGNYCYPKVYFYSIFGVSPKFFNDKILFYPFKKRFNLPTVFVKTTSSNGFVFGDVSKVAGINGIALGSNAKVDSANGIAIGTYVKSNAANSYVFGMGASSSAFLTNDKPNSLMFGVTHKPSLTIGQPTAGADRGYLGIGTTEPTEMAHIVGTLLIERTEETASRLQFKHPDNTAKGNDPHDTLVLDPQHHYWDIYSDTQGLKFNTVSKKNGSSLQRMIIHRNGSVGIGSGITTPLAKLHVDHNILAEGNITTFNQFVLARQ